jgi:hypothetical protein
MPRKQKIDRRVAQGLSCQSHHYCGCPAPALVAGAGTMVCTMRFSSKSKPVPQAAACPPFAKCAKSGAPIFIVVSAIERLGHPPAFGRLVLFCISRGGPVKSASCRQHRAHASKTATGGAASVVEVQRWASPKYLQVQRSTGLPKPTESTGRRWQKHPLNPPSSKHVQQVFPKQNWGTTLPFSVACPRFRA